ncbi:MAG: heavy-metal-associated domain-containing protein [Deltaproteobacteria bacterium]|nr:heavy-metal-associated domain-containing protein [Deltaproteobacteria bacterium]
MKSALFLVLAGISFTSATAFAKDQKATYTVKEWSCEGCAKKSTKALKQIEGVKEVAADLDKKELTVTYDDAKVKEAEIAAAVKKMKFNCD